MPCERVLLGWAWNECDVFLGDQGLDLALALLNSEVFVLASHECLDTSVPMATDKFYRNATI